MLRQVHPPPRGGQTTDPPQRRKGARSASLFLTPDEARHTRAAARAAARAYGGADVLAAVLGVPIRKVREATRPNGRPMSGTFAIRLAKVAGLSVEAVITGKLGEAGRCATCGHRIGEGGAS
jgi:hypothetical protein